MLVGVLIAVACLAAGALISAYYRPIAKERITAEWRGKPIFTPMRLQPPKTP